MATTVEEINLDHGCTTDGEVASDLKKLQSAWDVYHVPLTARRWLLEPLLNLVRRLFRRMLAPVLARQVEYNLAQSRMINFLLRRVHEQEENLSNLRQGMSTEVLGTKHEIENLQRDEISTKAEIAALSNKLINFQSELTGLQSELTDLSRSSIALPRVSPSADEAGSCFHRKEFGEWYRPAVLGPSTIGKYAMSATALSKVIEILHLLEPDNVIKYLLAYYEEGLKKYGEVWCYADVATVLVAIAQLMRPQRYLEVGVFHGRTMAMIGALCPECELVGFDLWISDYAGLGNPGPVLVRKQLERAGHKGRLTLISGNSHVTLPKFFAKNETQSFDVITIDGDHTEEGAVQDLRDVIPRLRIGGFLVFDDIVCSGTTYLERVWSQVVASDPRFVTWEFKELGNGVALALKQY
jgi:predicted O-methyltransferase YrrM